MPLTLTDFERDLGVPKVWGGGLLRGAEGSNKANEYISMESFLICATEGYILNACNIMSALMDAVPLCFAAEFR